MFRSVDAQTGVDVVEGMFERFVVIVSKLSPRVGSGMTIQSFTGVCGGIHWQFARD